LIFVNREMSKNAMYKKNVGNPEFKANKVKRSKKNQINIAVNNTILETFEKKAYQKFPLPPTADIVVIGDRKSGKSCLIKKLIDEEFLPEYNETTIETHKFELEEKEKKCSFSITEIGG
jgi:predicted AAA+ superfamily ATPase